VRIVFLLAQRVPDVPSPVVEAVSRLLRQAGHVVDGWIPEHRLLSTDPVADEGDLYVLKSHTELALSLAGLLHDRGARLLNPYLACVRAQDKVTASQALRAAGVPAPETWLLGEPTLAEPLLAGGPLVLKPHRGHRGTDVRLVRRPDELRALSPVGQPIVAQRFVPGPGEDLKVYVAGDNVYAVRKPFTAESFSQCGRPVTVTEQVYRIAQSARRSFGLELFGIDIIESPDGPVVVDVNYFPGYKGCAGPVAADIAAVILDPPSRAAEQVAV
jgi:ribosomal protein S6--L-glutamate ligase